MSAGLRIATIGGVALALAACDRLVDSRTTTVMLSQPIPAHCIERALDGIFGAGATRANVQATNYVVAAFPWEGYVRTRPQAGGTLAIVIELTRLNRYPDGTGSLAGRLRQAEAAVVRECGPATVPET